MKIIQLNNGLSLMGFKWLWPVKTRRKDERFSVDVRELQAPDKIKSLLANCRAATELVTCKTYTVSLAKTIHRTTNDAFSVCQRYRCGFRANSRRNGAEEFRS